MLNKMAYLGPQGTFCEEAAGRFLKTGSWEPVPYPSIEAVFAAVYQEEVSAGIVPIENSWEGSVNQTLDLLAYDYDLIITSEIIMPIRHNLLTRPGISLPEISRVLSHPQALAQCRRFLAANLPAAEPVSVTSTAEAARLVSISSEAWAAVGTAASAQLYGLKIGVANIADQPNNETRFVVISRQEVKCAGPYKTSLLLSISDQPGALFQALGEFSLRGINLSKIESRPAKTRMGEYLFFIDIDGHYREPQVAEAMGALKSTALNLRLLGSYTSAGKQKGPLVSGEITDLIALVEKQISHLVAWRERLLGSRGEKQENAY
ncbi:MAG: prephenate dehydratase [Bacillota bacterium]